MNIGKGFFASVVVGGIWGFIWVLVVSVLYMLITGNLLVPELGVAFIAGATVAGVYSLVPTEHRSAIVIALCILVMTLMLYSNPMAGEGRPLLHHSIVLLLCVGLIMQSIKLCLAGIHSAGNSRYQMEVLLIRALKGLGFVFFTAIVIIPFYVMVMTSLKSQQSLLANPLDFSIDVGQGVQKLFRSYIELFTQFDFGVFLINSAFVSVGTVLITLAFAIPGAYAVARLRFPGQVFLSRTILMIYMVPAIVLVIPLYAVFSQLGLRNTLTGLLVVYPATTIPVALYMLQGYFRGLPSELEEAGLMDGLSRVGVIKKITLPLSMPALASVALYVFMIAWNEFLFAFMFLDSVEIFTLSRGVVSLNSSEVPRQHLMAGAVVATVPVLFVFLWFEKFLVAGLTAGSVKG